MGNIKERLLVLAKACPVVSQKYENLVCVAGITESGEWRRIYPVPWEIFWKKKGSQFKKRMWIEYELESDTPSDHRPESRKLIPSSIVPDGEMSITEVKRLLDERLTSIEDLTSKGHKNVSLGVIKPIIEDLKVEKSEYSSKTSEMGKQQRIEGGSAVRIDIPEKDFRYVFRCNPSCDKKHMIKCEDWELTECFRHCKEYMAAGKAGYATLDDVATKVRGKFLTWMTEKREPYFIVGTHFKFSTYVIVGIIYPEKTL
jgi:hypothetical protein